MNEYIGIDIGGTKISVIRGDAAGNILEKKKFATKTKDETVQSIIADCNNLLFKRTWLTLRNGLLFLWLVI